MADAVCATLTLRNGECKEYKEVIEKQIGQEGSKINGLVKSLTKIQKDVNDSLTELVEAERGVVNPGKHNTLQDEDIEDDDDDDDDDEDRNGQISSTTDKNHCEPIPKKLKV